jgi:cytochrome c553
VNILLSTLTALLLVGCSGSADKSAKSEGADAPQETVAKAAEPAPQKAETAAPAAEAAPAPAPSAAPAPVAAADGDMLFKQKCASCHGLKGEKSALNVSQAIGGWEASKVVEAIKGYQAGTYGGNMKGMMQGQVRGLSEAQIEALAEYVAKQ